MNTDQMWNEDQPVSKFDIDVPRWIDQDITTADVAAIVEGGCASGAYMPAVTYHQALATMNEHGDNVFQYIEDIYGEIPQPSADSDTISWASLACWYMSVAVETWAAGAYSMLEDSEMEDA